MPVQNWVFWSFPSKPLSDRSDVNTFFSTSLGSAVIFLLHSSNWSIYAIVKSAWHSVKNVPLGLATCTANSLRGFFHLIALPLQRIRKRRIFFYWRAISEHKKSFACFKTRFFFRRVLLLFDHVSVSLPRRLTALKCPNAIESHPKSWTSSLPPPTMTLPHPRTEHRQFRRIFLLQTYRARSRHLAPRLLPSTRTSPPAAASPLTR